MLLSADFVFILLHTLRPFVPALSNPLFSIGEDAGYGEIFQYIKEFWAVLLVALVYVKTKEKGYFAWAFLFFIFLLEDSLLFHEHAGKFIRTLFNVSIFGIRPQSMASLIYILIVGLIFSVVMGLSFWRGSDSFKKISFDLTILVAALLFCGVFVDFVHDVFLDARWSIRFLLGLVEDGGEMLVISLINAYLFLLNRRLE